MLLSKTPNLDDILKQYTLRREVIKPNREVYIIDPTKIREVMQLIKNSYEDNVYLATIAGVDKAKENIFELNYFIHIVSLGKTIVIKTSIPRNNPKLDTIMDIIPGAYGAEAEIFDLLGIEFTGNKHLRRGFFVPLDIVSRGVYPLRKDAQV
ncbi:MAG: NADH-quinone oxidoreductase subunit C [Ignisphaera sp.]